VAGPVGNSFRYESELTPQAKGGGGPRLHLGQLLCQGRLTLPVHLRIQIGSDGGFPWRQEDDGCVSVTFQHEAADRDRAYGASERVASELGIGIGTVSVTSAGPSSV
jgi:hypothetical protein